MSTMVTWYKPNTLIYWNARGLRGPQDLYAVNFTLRRFLDDGVPNGTHLLMDWRDVYPGDALTGRFRLQDYFSFASHPNMGALMAFNIPTRALTGPLVLFAHSSHLSFRMTPSMQEALTALDVMTPSTLAG